MSPGEVESFVRTIAGLVGVVTEAALVFGVWHITMLADVVVPHGT